MMQVQSQTHHRENIYLGDLQTMALVCCARAIGEMVLMPPVTNPNPPHTPHKTSYFTIFSYSNYRLHLCVFVCLCPAKGAEYVNMEAQRSHNHSLAKLPRLDGSRFSLAASGWIS